MHKPVIFLFHLDLCSKANFHKVPVALVQYHHKQVDTLHSQFPYPFHSTWNTTHKKPNNTGFILVEKKSFYFANYLNKKIVQLQWIIAASTNSPSPKYFLLSTSFIIVLVWPTYSLLSTKFLGLGCYLSIVHVPVPVLISFIILP